MNLKQKLHYKYFSLLPCGYKLIVYNISQGYNIFKIVVKDLGHYKFEFKHLNTSIENTLRNT